MVYGAPTTHVNVGGVRYTAMLKDTDDLLRDFREWVPMDEVDDVADWDDEDDAA
jgi:hypothetical protein